MSVCRHTGVGLDVNAEKTKFIFMSRHQTTGQERNTKTGNKSFENETRWLYPSLANNHHTKQVSLAIKRLIYMRFESQGWYWLSLLMLSVVILILSRGIQM